MRGVDIGGGVLKVYRVLFPLILKLADCSVDGCLANEKKLREGYGNISFLAL